MSARKQADDPQTTLTRKGIASQPFAKKVSPMGFLKRIFRNVFRDGAPPHVSSSFERLSEDQLEAHLKVCRYGSFELTEAVRPSFDLQVVPSAGYRHDYFSDE